MPADPRPAGMKRRLSRVFGAAALAGILASGPAAADDEFSLEDATIGELSATVVQQVLAGDRASGPADKQKAYRTAHDVMRQLQRIAADSETIRPEQRPEDARAALADLANSGLTSDVLALHDFQWSLAAVGAAPASAPDAVGTTVDLDTLVRDIDEPRYRISAFVDLARFQLLRKAEARVKRYAKLAIGEAGAITDDRDRAAGALAVVRLLTDAGPERYAAQAEQAVALMPSASERAKASAVLARATLAAEDRSLDPAGLAARARSLLGGDGGPAPAAQLALAIPPKADVRGNVLEEVFAAALKTGDQDLAIRIGLGIPGEATQGKAFRRIVGAAIARGRPLQAVDLPAEITTPRESALAYLDLGKDLADRGYLKMAKQELTAAIAAAKAILDQSDRSKTLGQIAAAAADAGLAGVAAAAAKELDQPAPAPQRASQADPKPPSKGDRLTSDDKLAATARAALAKGDFAAAVAIAGRLQSQGGAGPLLADASIVQAAAGELGPALDRIRGLDDYRDRVRAFRAIAENAAGKLDAYGILAGRRSQPATPTKAATAIQPVELDGTDRVRVFRLDGVSPADQAPRLPNLDIHAADVLARVPPLEAGITDLSLARLNRFNAKFFEDIVGTSARDYLFSAQDNINPTYVFLSRGTFTLGQVAAQLGDGLGWEIGRDGEALILRVPLVIGPYATLVLSGAEAAEYRLSASRGAFLVNAGRLYITDTTLIAYDEEKKAPAFLDYEHKTQFRPFITAWSDSETYIAGSRLVAFGYGAGKTYGLSFTSGPREIVASRADSKPPTGIVVDSSFEAMLYGFYSFEAAGVSVVGNEYRDNIVYGVDPHDRSKDLRIAFNTAYGSGKKHGIIVSREVDDSLIVGNLSFANHGSGIMLDRSSVGNFVYANTAFDNQQDGVTLFESGCNALVSNDVSNNHRGGIKLRNSADVSVYRNRIGSNAGAGIEAYVARLETMKDSALRDFKLDPYRAVTSVAAAWNAIAQNGVGVTLDGANAASFTGNTFIKQSPKLYGGDLKSLRVRMLGYAAGAAPVLVTGQCPPPATTEKSCLPHHNGIMPDLGQSLPLNGSTLCLSQAPASPKEATE